MNAKEYWDDEWLNKPKLPVTDFAKKAYSIIKDNEFKEILDLGCGAGRDSLYFSDKGLQVTAIDISESGISLLKKENKKNIICICKDIRGIDFPDESFDVVYAYLVMHYLNHAETEAVMEKLYKMLKKGGYIFIKCKSTEDPLYGMGEKVEEDVYIHEHMRHFFTKDYMSEILKDFEILEVKDLSLKKRAVGHKYMKAAFIEAIAKK